ncbi:TonB-dependent receptor [Massilia sp. Root335]|uniref:TonB-dependent receptor n=1 Tax=Massilia sp. Root335 TaxID=1736517 RepID=UPI0009E9EBA4|nr:TonB-dependent receptor [Massilia sp. Root335]
MNQHRNIGPKMSVVALALAQAFAGNAFAQQVDPNANTVVVTGLRASAQSSVAIKRDTMEVVDSITAEDIGKLPDPNVAETLTRLPGVQGYRYGGEGASPAGYGSGLTIRGLAGQTASQVNGRAYFTAGAREFNIEDAIPGMIAGVDVYKNPSAEHIEGAIGGLVNIRTRNPSDFKGLTATLSTNARYNDLAKKTDPELFGLLANRFDLGGGSRIGVMAAFAFQKSTGRSDSTPANRAPDYRRVVRGDSAEYANMAASNTTNDPGKPMSKYVGRNDVSYLASVPTLATSPTVGVNMPNTAGLTPDQVANIISTPAVNTNVFQETIMRQRKGLNVAADYRVDNTLRFYVETNYTGYLYHQNYRFVFVDNGGNVQNLQTAPFAVTEGLANRNFNGGSNDILTTQRLQSGTFLNSQVRPWGGDEHSPYSTWIGAGGVEWSPTSALSLKADFSYIKADRKQDNRRVEMAGAAGLSWDVSRVADGLPHQIAISGPSLSDPGNFVYNWYPVTYLTWDDKGGAAALDGAYTFDRGFFDKLKFGTRFAHQQSLFMDHGFGRSLTTDGTGLKADRSNGISVAGNTGVLQAAPSNYMDGTAGYAGGYLVYNPDALLGNQVRGQFPNAGIPAEGSFAENPLAHRLMSENTLAAYLVGEFSGLDERLKGNVGVRVVRTRSSATARNRDFTQAALTYVDFPQSTTYTNVLPTFNATYDIQKDFLARFGYGRGMTRPDLGSLNPFINANVDGTGNMGNGSLRPQIADSFDFSLERYFNATNYVSAAVFDKKIKGFFSNLAQCMTVPLVAPYAGTTSNTCSGGQYLVTRPVNAEPGFARGIEVSGQWFFNNSYNWLKNFGVSGSYTYVDTSNPVNAGTAAAPVFLTTQQPFVSKNSYSVTGMYEDKKLSARLVYTWRSSQLWGGVNPLTPLGSGYIAGYGLLDASLNYAIDDHATLAFTASNLTDKAPNRFIGEAQTYETGRELQHFENGRTFSVGLRYKF